MQEVSMCGVWFLCQYTRELYMSMPDRLQRGKMWYRWASLLCLSILVRWAPNLILRGVSSVSKETLLSIRALINITLQQKYKKMTNKCLINFTTIPGIVASVNRVDTPLAAFSESNAMDIQFHLRIATIQNFWKWLAEFKEVRRLSRVSRPNS